MLVWWQAAHVPSLTFGEMRDPCIAVHVALRMMFFMVHISCSKDELRAVARMSCGCRCEEAQKLTGAWRVDLVRLLWYKAPLDKWSVSDLSVVSRLCMMNSVGKTWHLSGLSSWRSFFWCHAFQVHIYIRELRKCTDLVTAFCDSAFGIHCSDWINIYLTQAYNLLSQVQRLPVKFVDRVPCFCFLGLSF